MTCRDMIRILITELKNEVEHNWVTKESLKELKKVIDDILGE